MKWVKRRKKVLIILLLLIIMGGWLANSYAKKKGFKNVVEFVSVLSGNYFNSQEPKHLDIKIDQEGYVFFQELAQKALENGIHFNDGDLYVPCTIELDSQTVKGEIRLKGHMTDHFQGEKWSFRVKLKGKNNLWGMQRISLQHPGTRNYVYEWVFHELLKKEDVIALRYDFLNLSLNGNDLGVYAIEEHFGQAILNNNNRPKGPVFRFNPELYWQGRLKEVRRLRYHEIYSQFESSFIQPFEKGRTEKDSVLSSLFVKGVDLLDQFRRGIIPASKVFDLPKMASYHAIIDLVGGQHSMDWTDVKFYYNPATDLIEPIGYESFWCATNEVSGRA